MESEPMNGRQPFAPNSPHFAAKFLLPAFAGLITVCAVTWGSRPRLYASACSAGCQIKRIYLLAVFSTLACRKRATGQP
jgi:hypothetical protein